MYYYHFIMEIDNPMLVNLHKRTLTLYDTVWSDSTFLFCQYINKSIHNKKDIRQHRISGHANTIEELEHVINSYHLDFNEFYRDCKLHLYSNRDKTRYIVATTKKYKLAKIAIKRNLAGTLASAHTRMLLIMTILNYFGRKESTHVKTSLDNIYQSMKLIVPLEPSDVDTVQYMLDHISYSTIATNYYEL